jgi:hypothetical protein
MEKQHISIWQSFKFVWRKWGSNQRSTLLKPNKLTTASPIRLNVVDFGDYF